MFFHIPNLLNYVIAFLHTSQEWNLNFQNILVQNIITDKSEHRNSESHLFPSFLSHLNTPTCSVLGCAKMSQNPLKHQSDENAHGQSISSHGAIHLPTLSQQGGQSISSPAQHICLYIHIIIYMHINIVYTRSIFSACMRVYLQQTDVCVSMRCVADDVGY